MKKQIILSTIALGSLLSLAAAHAQHAEAGQILVKQKLVERVDSSLLIHMTFDLEQVNVPGGRSIVCTPLIERGDSVVALPQLLINSRARHILYERTGRNTEANGEFELRRYNDTPQTFDYHARIPFRKWMEKSDVSLVMDDCGCGWEALASNRSPLFPIRMAQPVVLDPVLVFRAPAVETVKARAKEGSAFLDFPVNKITIYPDYRRNPEELAKIRATVESVRNDKYATITEVSIKGYASPEGSYANNTYLAENRAKALRDYVQSLYHFTDTRFTIDFEPEDWAGLEQRVEDSSLPDRTAILNIIRADEPADLDKKEWKLKSLASYPTMLREIYPALRHSDYEVKYTIRNFTVDEAKSLLYTNPQQLSLDEMFRVAQTYEPGSREYNEVFEIAVRMYPDDPVSNLNAALTAIAERRFDAARGYLAKAAPSPKKQLAEASLYMLEGKLDEAESILKAIQDEPAVSGAAQANLEQITAKRSE